MTTAMTVTTAATMAATDDVDHESTENDLEPRVDLFESDCGTPG